MFSRFRISIALAFLLSLVLAIPVFAGGWAVITLDELPTDVVAGEPFTVGFMVLQHGKTPMDGLEPTIIAKLSKSESFVVYAEPDGKRGHYVATLTFPAEGNWNWTINAFSMEQAMPTLSVAAPIAGSAIQQSVAAQATPTLPLLVVRIIALVIGLVGLGLAYQRKSRLAVAVTVACLLVGVGSFVVGSNVPAVEAESKSSSEVVNTSSTSQVEFGRQLFIAKGCITCHYNTKAARTSEYWTIEMGAPNLSNFSASPEVLRIRLKDPAAAKSDTQMPNLDLTEVEIEALIVFINSN